MLNNQCSSEEPTFSLLAAYCSLLFSNWHHHLYRHPLSVLYVYNPANGTDPFLHVPETIATCCFIPRRRKSFPVIADLYFEFFIYYHLDRYIFCTCMLYNIVKTFF